VGLSETVVSEEATRYSETSDFNKPIRRHIPENDILLIKNFENAASTAFYLERNAGEKDMAYLKVLWRLEELTKPRIAKDYVHPG
jgi:hypothetical protein